jgi:predicted dehydrogenase
MMRLALIGCGYMGGIYRRAYEEIRSGRRAEDYYKGDLPRWLRGLRLVAVADPVPARAPGCRWFASVDDLLASGIRVDCAILATPIPTHYPLARQLIEHGVHLLIEKPVSETAAEVRSLVRLAARRGVRIMPGHIERYNPVTLDVRETVRYRMYGRLKNYSFIRTGARPGRVRVDLVLDKLIHDIDLVHCTVGPFRVDRVSVRRRSGQIVECTLTTRHRNGVKGRIFSSWIVSTKRRQVEFEFERATLYGDLLEKTLRIRRHREMPKEITGYRNNQIRDQLADFIYFLHSRGGRVKPLVTMSDALTSAKVLDEIRKRGVG